MEFKIRKGEVPSRAKSDPGIYDSLRMALIDAAVDEWLHVDIPKDDTERVRASLTSGTNSWVHNTLKLSGFTVQTAARTHSHDPAIPNGTSRLFFRKIRIKK